MDVDTDGVKKAKHKKFAKEQHDEFVKELQLGDIVSRPASHNRLLYHAGIYVGPSKGRHEIVKKSLESKRGLLCPMNGCHQDLASGDCGHNMHFIVHFKFNGKGPDDGVKKKTSDVRDGDSSELATDSSGLTRSAHTTIEICTLRHFMKKDGTYKNNFGDGREKVKPVRKILEMALKAVMNPPPDKYDAFKCNCEHFVTKCRYGVSFSMQAPNMFQGHEPFQSL